MMKPWIGENFAIQFCVRDIVSIEKVLVLIFAKFLSQTSLVDLKKIYSFLGIQEDPK